tara:strand:- start:652819 stop:656415 length:3597 start_codon:yes stop_codon:yes gene_type:complete
MNRYAKLLIVLCTVGSLGSGVVVADDSLRAGAAAVNVDPLKLPILRNGGFVARMVNRVEQSLYARSLVIENDSTRIAICVVDTCMIDRELCDRAKAMATRQTGIPSDRILISATHTHNAPSAMRCLGVPADPDYQHFLANKIAESISAAASQVRPAKAGWCVVDAPELTNPRRWIYLPHKMRHDPFGNLTVRAMMHPGHANPDTAGPSGPIDPDFTILSLRDQQGHPLAVLGNYSMHYFGASQISSDYTGKVCQLLEEEMNKRAGSIPAVAIMSQGTSGDLQHRDYSKPNVDGKVPFAAYCQKLASFAVDGLKQIKHRSDLPLAMAETQLTLGRRLPDQERLEWAKGIVEQIDDLPQDRPQVAAMEAFWIRDNPVAQLKLQAIRIGDFAIATLPNEVYGITGLKLKMQSPFPVTMNIELANGADGYIPPPEQHHLGGYTTWPARTAGLEAQAEPKIVSSLLGLLEDVSGKPRREMVDAVGDHGHKLRSRLPKAWWRMSAHSGDRIADASGNGFDGKLEPGYALFLPGPESGHQFTSTPRGNRAVHFAGGRMTTTDAAPSGDYSASFWFWNAMPEDARRVCGYVFSIGGPDSSHGDHLGISGTASEMPGRLLLYNGDAKKEERLGSAKVELHRWYHVLVTRNGPRVQVYLDGNVEPEIDCELTDTRPADAEVFVGGRGDAKFNFEGKVDEVAIFDEPLGAADAMTLGRVMSRPNEETAKVKHPNVLFIGVDDLRPELGCYGADYIHSPSIDRLASEGLLFKRAYCQWAVCMPSRASLLSGLRPNTFKGKANQFRKVVPDVVTMPQHFRNHGYFTQSFGKVFHGAWETAYVGDSYQDPLSWSAPRFVSSPQYYFSPRGIATAREIFATATPKFLFLGDAQRNVDDPDQWKQYFVRGLSTEAPDVSDDVPGDGIITEAALDRIRSLAESGGEQPFFLAVGFMKPHLPFVAPKRYWDLYKPSDLPPVEVSQPPSGAPRCALTGSGELHTYSDIQSTLTADQVRRLRHGYAACVSYIDAQVGRLLDELDALQLRDDTIVVLWSDHGYKLGDFGAWCKHTNFELDTHVPLIVSAPGKRQAARTDALVELVDLHPTLSELAGLPVHQGADGVSFAGVVNDARAHGEDAAFSQYPRGKVVGYTMRTADHRYTLWRNSETGAVEAVELYDYRDSPIERVNLAGDPAFADMEAAMRSRLLRQFGFSID